MSNTIDFNTQQNLIKEQVANYSLIPVDLAAVRKDGNCFSYNDHELAPQGIKHLFNTLDIKDKILEDIKDDAKQWEPLHTILSDIKKQRGVAGVLDVASNRIVRLINRRVTEPTAINVDKGLEYTQQFLENSSDPYRVRRMEFNLDHLGVDINFENPNSQVDVFGDAKDIWTTGFGMSFNDHRLQSFPFFLRLVCSNGMQALHRMSQRLTKDEPLSGKTFAGQLGKLMDPSTYVGEIVRNCNRMRDHSASLREYYAAVKLVKDFDADLAEDLFTEEDTIKAAYMQHGIDITKRNTRWKANASSNVNSYDLFNLLTHTATHRPGDESRAGLNKLASDLFYKGPDLTQVAINPFN